MLIDKFVEWMETWTDTEKYELLDGRPIAMSRGTLDSEAIAGNLSASLSSARDRGCRALRDLLLRSPVSDRFGVFPDVYVRCGPPGDGRRTWVDDAVAVFEILSPSTIAIDRGYKQDQYLRMPTLQHYVLIHPREFRVETWSRDADGGWSEFPVPSVAIDGQVDLPALGLSIPMADLYADTDLVRAAG
jgi:Uma2 family endonuclease